MPHLQMGKLRAEASTCPESDVLGVLWGSSSSSSYKNGPLPALDTPTHIYPTVPGTVTGAGSPTGRH